MQKHSTFVTTVMNMPVFSVDLFFFHKDDKSFSQEASTLDIRAGEYYDFIKLVNPKTCGSKIYKLSKTICEDDEVQAWEYTAIDKDLKLTILND